MGGRFLWAFTGRIQNRKGQRGVFCVWVREEDGVCAHKSPSCRRVKINIKTYEKSEDAGSIRPLGFKEATPWKWVVWWVPAPFLAPSLLPSYWKPWYKQQYKNFEKRIVLHCLLLPTVRNWNTSCPGYQTQRLACQAAVWRLTNPAWMVERSITYHPWLWFVYMIWLLQLQQARCMPGSLCSGHKYCTLSICLSWVMHWGYWVFSPNHHPSVPLFDTKIQQTWNGEADSCIYCHQGINEVPLPLVR